MSTEPWRGRALHFVGIGGAGMSGLALVAHALGATRHGLRPRGRLALRRRRCAPRASSRRSGHDAANVPAGRRARRLLRDPAREPGAGDRPRARPARAAPRRSCSGELTRLRPTVAVTGTHGKTTTSSMLVHALRGCGHGSRLPRRRRRPLDRRQRRLGGGGVARGRGRRVRPLAARAAARPSPCSRTPSSTTTRRTPPSATSTTRSGPSSASRSAPPSSGTGPALLALAPAGLEVVPFDAEPELTAGGSRFTLDGVDGRAGDARAPTTPATPPRRCSPPASPAPTSRRPRPRCATSRARAGASSGSAAPPAGAEVVDDYAHHPTEVAATLEAARTLAPRRVIAVFQPHLFSRTARTAAEFGAALAARRRGRRARRLPGARARGGLPGRRPGCSSRGRRPTPAAGRPWPGRPTRPPPRPTCARACATGDLVLTLGAGDIDALGRALVA